MRVALYTTLQNFTTFCIFKTLGNEVKFNFYVFRTLDIIIKLVETAKQLHNTTISNSEYLLIGKL